MSSLLAAGLTGNCFCVPLRHGDEAAQRRQVALNSAPSHSVPKGKTSASSKRWLEPPMILHRTQAIPAGVIYMTMQGKKQTKTNKKAESGPLGFGVLPFSVCLHECKTFRPMFAQELKKPNGDPWPRPLSSSKYLAAIGLDL